MSAGLFISAEPSPGEQTLAMLRALSQNQCLALLRRTQGFTLIELLAVIVVIGVLAAVAIPQYQGYRQKAFDAVAQSDLRHAITAEEQYYVQNESYASCNDVATCMQILSGFRSSDPRVEMAIQAAAGEFVGTSQHSQGAGGIWRFESQSGRFIYRQ